MNIHTSRLKEFRRPESMNWTLVEVPIQEPVELQPESAMAQHLKRRAFRVGKRGASALFFLTLGATGLWAVVDLVKIVVGSFKNK